MKTLSRTALFALTLVISLSLATTAQAGRGWLENISGGHLSTPEPIRKIAHNGISMRRKETRSYLPAESKPYIDAKGNVWSGTAHSGQKPSYKGHAEPTPIGDNLYWTTNYSDPYGKPAPRFIRNLTTRNPQYRPQPQPYYGQPQFRRPPQPTPQQMRQMQQRRMFEAQIRMQNDIYRQQQQMLNQSIQQMNQAVQQHQYRRQFRR